MTQEEFDVEVANLDSKYAQYCFEIGRIVGQVDALENQKQELCFKIRRLAREKEELEGKFKK